jgi:hypothetical protein
MLTCSPSNPVHRLVRGRIIRVLAGLLLFATLDSRAADSTSAHAYLRLPIVYVRQSGTQLDGYHVQSFDSRHIAHLPKLSDSLGIRPSVGVLIENALRGLNVSAGLNLEYTGHRAISYNVGNSWYEHDTTSLLNGGLDLRGYVSIGHFKPFIGVTPGYGWLRMPNGVTVTTVDSATGANNISWSDITLRGVSFEASAGLLYEFIPLISADASFGYRLQRFNSSSLGSLNGYGFSPALIGSLGVLLKI